MELDIPYSIEAESALIAAIINIGAPVLARVEVIVSPIDFYRNGHAVIYKACYALYTQGIPIDRVTLRDQLIMQEQMEEVGGQDYLNTVIRMPGNAANASAYAAQVADLAWRRRMIEATYEAMHVVQDRAMSAEEISSKTGALILKASANEKGKTPWKNVVASLDDFLEDLRARRRGDKDPIEMHSGFSYWDTCLGGLRRANLILIAGRPSMGKSAAALNIAVNVAKRGQVVAFFSLEMSEKDLVSRIVSSEAQVDGAVLDRGSLDEEEMLRVEGVERFPNLIFDCSSDITEIQIANRCRQIKAEYGRLDLVIVDYLQIVRPSIEERNGNRSEKVTAIARGLKRIAKDMDIPVLALAQLNRNVEKRDNKRPVMSDLSESGGIEAECDSITFLYRPMYYKLLEDGEAVGDGETIIAPEHEEAEWIIEKNRHGRNKVAVRTMFTPSLCRFDNISYREDMF